MCCNRLEVEDLNCISKTGFRNGYPPQTLYWLYIFWLWWCPPKRNSLKLYFILKVNNTRFKKFLRFSIRIVNWKNIYPEYFSCQFLLELLLAFEYIFRQVSHNPLILLLIFSTLLCGVYINIFVNIVHRIQYNICLWW